MLEFWLSFIVATMIVAYVSIKIEKGVNND